VNTLDAHNSLNGEGESERTRHRYPPCLLISRVAFPILPRRELVTYTRHETSMAIHIAMRWAIGFHCLAFECLESNWTRLRNGSRFSRRAFD